MFFGSFGQLPNPLLPAISLAIAFFFYGVDFVEA